MSFYETPRFPDTIAYQATGGPEFSTTVVIASSGYEQRNSNWSSVRHRYDVGYTARTQSQKDEIAAFFMAMGGRQHGFRFKDWADFEATVTTGYLGAGAVGTGLATYQMLKHYANGAVTYQRTITKPVSGSISLTRAGSPVTLGAGAGNAAIDTTTGIVTFVADDSESITGHTPGASHQFTTAADMSMLAIGEKVYISGATVSGGTDVVNGVAHTISNKSGAGPYTWTLSTTTTGLTVSGGTAYAYPQAGEALKWAGQFDVPTRFDTDRIDWQIANRSGTGLLFVAQSIGIVEIRL